MGSSYTPPATSANAMTFIGSTNCSGNPNYPVASRVGDVYRVSTAGKIGGASGVVVSVGDIYYSIAANAGGTHGAVGASWNIQEANIPGITAAGLQFIQAPSVIDQMLMLNVMSGDQGSGGSVGLVPVQNAGDAAAGKFLKADGVWAAPPGTTSGVAVADVSGGAVIDDECRTQLNSLLASLRTPAIILT